MEWMKVISESIQYIESHLLDDISAESVAKQFHVSPSFFQKGFKMITGWSISEYIRNRRLSLAGNDLLSRKQTITDIAMKYHYDSPDSFTKAFCRFHGTTPSAVRRGEGTLKTFSPLKVKMIVEGGFLLDYRIVKRNEFTVVGKCKEFPPGVDGWEINRFWQDFASTDAGKSILKSYGVNIDCSASGGVQGFEYCVAEEYDP